MNLPPDPLDALLEEALDYSSTTPGPGAALVGHLREVVLELRGQATVDPLTGLLNRRGGEAAVARMLARGDRQRTPVSLVLIDLDHFKRVNDRHGHVAGDRTLRQVATMLKVTLRAIDAAARWGGEEILIATENDFGGAMCLAERLREACESTVFADDAGTEPVTASIGVVEYHGEDMEKLLCRVDAAMYRAKLEGRNCVRAA